MPRLHGTEITFESLTIRHDGRDDSFEVIKVCPRCKQNVALHSTEGRCAFSLGLNVDLVNSEGIGRVRNVKKCQYCGNLVEFTPKETKVLDLRLEEFRKWFESMPKTPKWDGTWKTDGLLKEE